jgi:hypothetical protein
MWHIPQLWMSIHEVQTAIPMLCVIYALLYLRQLHLPTFFILTAFVPSLLISLLHFVLRSPSPLPTAILYRVLIHTVRYSSRFSCAKNTSGAGHVCLSVHMMEFPLLEDTDGQQCDLGSNQSKNIIQRQHYTTARILCRVTMVWDNRARMVQNESITRHNNDEQQPKAQR